MAKKNIFLIQDDGTSEEITTYGVIETDKSMNYVQDTIDFYKKENPEHYNWDTLKQYLISNGFELIEYEEVYF